MCDFIGVTYLLCTEGSHAAAATHDAGDCWTYNALREGRGFRNLLYALYEGEGVFVFMLYNALKSIGKLC